MRYQWIDEYLKSMKGYPVISRRNGIGPDIFLVIRCLRRCAKMTRVGTF